MTVPGPPDAETIDVAISLCELVETFDRIEAVLLSASSRDRSITPDQLAASADLDDQTAQDILLQLRRAGAAESLAGDRKAYAITAGTLRPVLRLARLTRRIVERHGERQPPQSQVEPLVTFPEDPSFEGTVPQNFGMDWLMPSLTGMIQRADSRIVLLAPFFEREGFGQIGDPIQHALDRGVEVVVVTRYLRDQDSHNRDVLAGFIKQLDEEGVDRSRLQLVDYTVWPEDVDPADRDEPGVNPSFTLHSKLLLVDDEEVYVGSANVTGYGFSQYLETGVRLEGPVVNSYGKLVERLLASTAATEWEPVVD